MAEFEPRLSEEDIQPILTLVKNEQVLHGPKVADLLYQSGGHSELIGQAMVAKDGKLKLTPEDMMDPKKVPHIHPVWRDELEKGSTLELRSWGKMDVIHPKPQEVTVYEKDS